MAENILLKARVKSIHLADPIASAAAVESAIWTDAPLTLRDDEVSIVDDEPSEDEVYSHENDVAEDYDVAGTGSFVAGSFIKVTYDQLATLLGGATVSNQFHRSAKRVLVNKAIKFTLKDDSTIIVPNAKGMVRANLGLGFQGRQKFPFKFKCLPGSSDWNVDLIW